MPIEFTRIVYIYIYSETQNEWKQSHTRYMIPKKKILNE